MIRILLTAASTATLAAVSNAFVMIDDFTVGAFEGTQFGNGTIQREQTGLDKNHVAFGDRFTVLEIGSNRPQDAVTLRLGNGEAKVTSVDDSIATTFRVEYGFSDAAVLDLSRESEIWVDLYTQDPANRIADFHDVYVRDTHGISDITTSWSQRQGGIRFKKTSFDPRIDWAHIDTLIYRVRYSFISGPHPLGFSTQRVYAVPEPTSIAIMGLAAGIFARRRRWLASQPTAGSTVVEEYKGSPCIR